MTRWDQSAPRRTRRIAGGPVPRWSHGGVSPSGSWADRASPVPGGRRYRLRSRKSWALLAYLLLTEATPTRSQLAGLLFPEADDPLRALRWSLAEIRRGLGDGAALDGDPVVLRLPADAFVDVDVLSHESWADAVEVVGLDAELLDGLAIRGAPAFESWLLSRAPAPCCGRRGDPPRGRPRPDGAGRARPGPRLRRTRGRDEPARREPPGTADPALPAGGRRRRRRAAVRRVDASCSRRELGVEPGAAVRPRCASVPASVRACRPTPRSRPSSRRAPPPSRPAPSNPASPPCAARSGSPTPVGRPPCGSRSRQVLAEALIHSLRGLDEEGLAHLHEADRLAADDADPISSAQARAELGYVDFLRARYDRAELWLTDALEPGGRAPVPCWPRPRPTSARCTATAATTRRPSPCSTRRCRPLPRGRRPAPRGLRAVA